MTILPRRRVSTSGRRLSVTATRPSQWASQLFLSNQSFGHLVIVQGVKNRTCGNRPATIAAISQGSQDLVHRLKRSDLLLNVGDLGLCTRSDLGTTSPRPHSNQ